MGVQQPDSPEEPDKRQYQSRNPQSLGHSSAGQTVGRGGRSVRESPTMDDIANDCEGQSFREATQTKGGVEFAQRHLRFFVHAVSEIGEHHHRQIRCKAAAEQ